MFGLFVWWFYFCRCGFLLFFLEWFESSERNTHPKSSFRHIDGFDHAKSYRRSQDEIMVLQNNSRDSYQNILVDIMVLGKNDGPTLDIQLDTYRLPEDLEDYFVLGPLFVSDTSDLIWKVFFSSTESADLRDILFASVYICFTLFPMTHWSSVVCLIISSTLWNFCQGKSCSTSLPSSKDVDADQHFMSFKFELVEGHQDNLLMVCGLLGTLIVEPYDYILDDQECLTEEVSRIRFNTTVQRLSCILYGLCDCLFVVGCNCQRRRCSSLDIEDHQCLNRKILSSWKTHPKPKHVVVPNGITGNVIFASWYLLLEVDIVWPDLFCISHVYVKPLRPTIYIMVHPFNL